MIAVHLLLVASLVEIAPTEVLVIPSVGRGGRVPVQTDAIQYLLTTNQWSAPTDGDSIRTPAGQEVEWKLLRAGDDGMFRDRALSGGYAFWSFEHPRDEVMLLEAAGHSMVYTNGEPRVGDVYSFGYTKLPVKLRGGKNEFLFNVARGSFSAKLTHPKAEAFFNTADLTLPDAIAGETGSLIGGIIVVNASDRFVGDLEISVDKTVANVPLIPPLSARKVHFYIPQAHTLATGELKFSAVLKKGSQILDEATLATRLRNRSESHKRTFVSRIDGSVQYYAVRPEVGRFAGPKPAIVLTAHGAGVEAIGQVDAYASKSWAHIVAPTNRRPYGFDWEDWGRLDAIEVLEEAKRALEHDPARIYLTGHSMGGHGAWILGVTHPNLFAAIGPSAGWISFSTYAGGTQLQPTSQVEEVLKGAMLPSDTVGLIRNLAPLGIYILHGGADDNVPVAQARQMVEHLKEFHSSFEYHEQTGAGHWWDSGDEPGAACVDWPPMFDMFSRRRIPTVAETRRVHFRTPSPGISSKSGPIQIVNLIRDGEACEIEAASEPHSGTATIRTTNIRRFVLDDRFFLSDNRRVVIDDQTVELGHVMSGHNLVNSGSGWSVATETPTNEKNPDAYGPFKNAFTNRMVFVVGTRGNPDENAWMLAKARYDAETFWYRGNGSIDVVTDVMSMSMDLSRRNVILFGNEDVNSAWRRLLSDGEVKIHRGLLEVGDLSSTRDDLAMLLVRPHPQSSGNLVGVIGFTGLRGARTIERSPYFVSGASFPDWLILSPRCLLSGNEEIVGAGFFGADWRIRSGNHAWGKR